MSDDVCRLQLHLALSMIPREHFAENIEAVDAIFAELARLRTVLAATEKKRDEARAAVGAVLAAGVRLHAALVAAEKERDKLRAAVEKAAETQEHFASEAYTQHTDADRRDYLHAAKLLRALLARAGETT